MEEYKQWVEIIKANYGEVAGAVIEYLPSLAGAVFLLLIGWLLAHLLRSLVHKLGQKFDHLMHPKALDSISTSWQNRWPVSRMLGGIIYWVIILFFLTAATESLGLPGLADVLGQILNYLPELISAAAIIFIGYLISLIAREGFITAASAMGVRQAGVIGQFISISILILAILLGLSQLNVDVSLLTHVIVILIASASGALALSFGLGARTAVSNIIAAHYLKQTYQIGQRIRINDYTGEIIKITTHAVTIDTHDGIVLIPAKIFSESASVLMDSE